jgi:O-antigen/teichoic acid export membrane protein
MTPNLSRNLPARSESIVSGVIRNARQLPLKRLFGSRQALLDYCQVLAGTGGRLTLQVVYFLVLANTLNLRQMGIFASISAAGVMLGCLTGLGFQSILFRSAATRRSSLGGYFAVYYACFAAALPVSLSLSAALYLFLFKGGIGFAQYLAIILVEIVLWRAVEMLVQVNNGLGRYNVAATIIMASSGLRTLAAVAFMIAGGGDAGVWAFYYFAANAASVAVLTILYHPRIRLRWRKKLLVGRLRNSLLYAFAYFAFLAQNEADKLVILWLAGDRTAGVYAISMRIIDLTAVPLRPIFVLYSRRLMKIGRATPQLLREIIRVEGLVALVSTAGFLAVLALLTIWPRLLGQNVTSAAELLAVIVAVPAAKNLLEFHAELFFAFNRMGLHGTLAAGLVVLKAAALGLVLATFHGSQRWGLGLNAIYGALYLVSFAMVRNVLLQKARS